ncbi:SprB repeat-containing protein, partial [Candidatus Dependentiae bacterium]|nr:SprB repeat-containing protein [Candidatus Dependentiae bacterium]
FPVEYSIDNGVTFQSCPQFTGLAAGVYNIVVRGNGLCAVRTVTLGQPSGLTFTVVTTSPGCLPNALGTLTITATGGVAPFRFSIDNGRTFQASPVFMGLAAGIYRVVVEDVNGNAARQNVAVGAVIQTTGNPTIDFILAKYCSNCVVIQP